MKLDLANLLIPTTEIAKEAGLAILAYYQNPDRIHIRVKRDASPVTEADLIAHEIIKKSLQKLTPNIPILSEEAAEIPFQQRKQWSQYWLVDPLDGTKEFIHHTDDFTVNIALIEKHQPILGVVYAPVFDTYYFAARGLSAFKKTGQDPAEKIFARQLNLKNLIIAISRRHGSSDVKNFLMKVNSYEVITRGSSLKSCLIAEGKVDLYPCLGLTSEWDMAAAQCIVEEAGGVIIDTQGDVLRYNTKDSLLNPQLLIMGDRSYDWLKYFG